MDLIPTLPDEIAGQCLMRLPYTTFSTMAAVSKGWKEEIQSPQFQHQRKASGFTQPIVVLIQAEPNRGFGALKYPAAPAYSLTLYEPATGSFRKLPPPPGFADGLPLFCKCAGVGRKLVVLGGWHPVTWEVTNTVFVYDFLSSSWQRGADVPGVRRSFFACASDSDRMVFVAGGHDEDKNALGSAMAYDTMEDRWVPLPDMMIERDECKGIFHAGKFHVFSGYSTHKQGQFEKSSVAFNIATWHWDQVQEVDMSRGAVMCPRTYVAGEGGKFYSCLGGYVAEVEAEAGSGPWRGVAELPPDVCEASCLLTCKGKLFVAGLATHGGCHMAYTSDLLGWTWMRFEAPEEYSGYVHAGCCLEI